MVKVALIQFPGSNCDLDALEILQKTVRVPTDLVWHKDLKKDQYDAYVLPGGFSYGDYLRAGAIESTRTPFTNLAKKGQTLRIPIAHNEGRYYLDKDQLVELDKNEQVVLRYVDENNTPTQDSNPNGTMDNIAGVRNKTRNVMGLMPHPERASLPILSPNHQPDGRLIFDSMISSFENTVERSI